MSTESLPPHWLDEVFENCQDSDELLATLLNAPEMQEIASKAFEAGEEQRKNIEQNPGISSSSVAQTIRRAFLSRIAEPSREAAIS